MNGFQSGFVLVYYTLLQYGEHVPTPVLGLCTSGDSCICIQ